MDPNFVRDIIKSNPLFADLSIDDMDMVVKNLKLQERTKGSILCLKNEDIKGLYFLVEGVLRKEFHPENTHLVYLGSIIGAQLIICPEKKLDATYLCESQCKVIFIPLEMTRKFLAKYINFEKTLYFLSIQHYFQCNKLKSKIVDVF